jgi:trans-aconitate 2-methyltransferase
VQEHGIYCCKTPVLYLEISTMHKWDAELYERSSSAQFKWAMELISHIDIAPDTHILDIGCGDGKITAYLATIVPQGHVLGIDLSSEMIRFALAKYSSKDNPSLSFQVGDAACLTSCEEYDLVLSFACLHWIKDMAPVLKGVRRSLRPGGRILFQCGGKGNAAKLLEVTEEITRDEPFAGYFQGFGFPYYFRSPDEYDSWLRQAGLMPMRVELVQKDMVHQGVSGLESFIRSTWLPYLERLPESLLVPFVSEVASRYIDCYPLDDQGRSHVQMVRLEVEAERVG